MSPGRGPKPRRLSACRMPSSSDKSLMGKPFRTFEDSADLFLSFLSLAARTKGAAKTAKVKRNSNAIPVTVFFCQWRNTVFRGKRRFIFPAPCAAIGITRAAGDLRISKYANPYQRDKLRLGK